MRMLQRFNVSHNYFYHLSLGVYMKQLIVFILMILFFVSCNKENSDPISPDTTQDNVKDYLPLEIGNYWIYEYYIADSTLQFVKQNFTDSLFVEKDTIVNGSIYKVLKSSFLNKTLIIKDSADCLVLVDGHKLLTTNQNINILDSVYYPENDTAYLLVWEMNNKDSICSVPSGQYRSKFVFGSLNSTIQNDPNYNERNIFYAYAKNIGIVSRRLCYLYAEVYIEERLLRYKIK